MTSNARGRVDGRAQRTRRSLATALVALAPERGLDAVPVGELARRAGVSRSTFYSHFASKADFLTSSFVGMIDACEAAAARRPDRTDVLPTRELFAHIRQAGPFAAAFARSRELPRMLAAAEVKLRAIAEANLARRSGLLPEERRPAAVFLAGGLVGTLRWWIETGLRQEPEALHTAFAEFTRRTLTP